MWKLAEVQLKTRFILGSAQYPSPEVLHQSILASGAQVVTVALRRQSPEVGGGIRFWEVIKSCLKSVEGRVLPNTAHCRTAKEAILTAHMARELFGTHWIKLEVIGDEASLAPDPFELVEAARVLCQDGFEVFPYTTEDIVVAERLLHAGCHILMPWASPIGSGQGLIHKSALREMRHRFPEATLIVDAGIGRPSDAAYAMEMGFDGVLLNTAVAKAHSPVKMAEAFREGILAGRKAFEAGIMAQREGAVASTPLCGLLFSGELS